MSPGEEGPVCIISPLWLWGESTTLGDWLAAQGWRTRFRLKELQSPWN